MKVEIQSERQPERQPDPALALMARAPDAIVGWQSGRAISAHAMLQRVAAWQAALATRAGQNLALYLEDTLEFGAALLAAWQAGKTVWLVADTLPATCAALARSVDFFVGEFPASQAPLQLTTDAADSTDIAPAVLTALDWQAAALVVHTSGSSGQPQAIPKRMAQILHEVATLETAFGARLGQGAAAAQIVATVSHQHIYGLLFKLLWPLASGRPIHAISLSYPEQLLGMLASRPCALIASPAHLKRLPEHLDWSAVAQHTRVVFSSGGMLPGEVAHATARWFGQAPLEVYGSSETGGIAWRQRQLGQPDSWQAFAQVGWRISSDSSLQVRSPHLPDDGWMTLSDQAQYAGNGHFILLGRSDRIVKIEEKRVSLNAMEAALLASNLVDDVRIVLQSGTSEERQRLAAFVVASSQGRALLADGGKASLNQALRQVLGGVVEAVALPRRWRYLEQMPVNAQGKTSQAQLLALLDGGPGGEQDSRPRLPQVRLLEQQAERVLLEVTVPATLLYLDGHFSRAPVLPGVVQVDWAIHYGRHYLQLPPDFRGIHTLKFQNLIRAESPVQLELSHDAAKSVLQFRYFSEAGQHASGRVLFAESACKLS